MDTLPANVVLGAQWGDEGKGKAIDQLAAHSDWAVRFQGGNNAGHTVVVGDITLKLHLLPSGITASNCRLVLGCGTVVDPWVLDQELERWHALTGEKPEGQRLFISERAAVILPFHRLYDSADSLVGTTGRGIGPAYRDRTERVGLRFVDLPHVVDDSEAIQSISERMNKQLVTVGVEQAIDPEQLQSEISWVMGRFSDAIRPTGPMLDKALRAGERVLLEGAQGIMLDIDQGTYPFVTSSITGRANATHGAGIHPGHIEQCFGISKAYTTRVGNGPFPTELSLEEGPGKQMSEVGHEFGTTTGRPRRTGWLDLVVLMEGQRINGHTGLVITKLDVLGGLDELKLCVSYELDGEETQSVPASCEDYARCTPIYEVHPGFPALSPEEWIALADESRQGGGLSVLPEAMRDYLARIEQAIGVPVVSVGVGPDRRASIASSDGPFDVLLGEATF
ncbi:MAG: adenylosuccinate synthase [Candidatus Thalassarchaeaceae archaeon]|jgi:adenylosuccinate synthase|nr:adenylosuccinate synthase [Euryarchaeota archaeon]MDP7092199.1 adenylosuccinate synthase [Candidatus Thalassarchaeaceae archaeon]MDP7257017.1 adenylosuccinate synthase [Candidatus Thalassarchaeaceae archaeon]MDP7446365.1 adenylosuccinate synthase [Candidatus Thalassarchaeaceae archaeon]MDP7649265.1 adenylosuccinate synthase [Candidatus Thalassarchaeaceae archaeon]|tara:strand:- start:4375 stop:5727 length:1353 start_codon:yes stop_codon:yes gene_type:complete